MLTFVFFLIDRRNQFAWVSKTSGAQFVHINLVQSNTCKDIFEYILANSHLNVWYVSKNSIDKIIVTLIWENVFNDFMNLELNKYCYLLKKIKIIFFFFSIDRRNQFIWATWNLDAHFVQKNLEQSNTCNIIFEYILVKSHSNVFCATKNLLKNQVVICILELFIKKWIHEFKVE